MLLHSLFLTLVHILTMKKLRLNVYMSRYDSFRHPLTIILSKFTLADKAAHWPLPSAV
jgi:hypothetical protein